MLKLVIAIADTVSAGTGLWAAWLWWQSSKVPVPERTPPFLPGHTTGDPTVEQIGETVATTLNLLVVAQASRETAWISGRAAWWTAISVGAQVVALTLGWIPSG